MMQAKTLFLHIGAEKTGSTAIQAFLASVPSLLRKHRYYYINPSHPSWISRSFDTRSLHCDLVGEHTRPIDINNIITSAIDLDCDFYIISSEYLYSRLRAVKDIKALASFLQKSFDRVIVIAYHRDACHLLNSLSTEAIKAGEATVWNIKRCPYNEYFQHALAFESVMEVWSRYFDDVITLSYDQAIKDSSDVKVSFLQAIRLVDHVDRAKLSVSLTIHNARITHLSTILISIVVCTLTVFPDLSFETRRKTLAVARKLIALLQIVIPSRLQKKFNPFTSQDTAKALAIASSYKLT